MATGYVETPVPNGHMAEVVTYLETSALPETAPDGPWRLEPWPQPAIAPYRDLYRQIGEEWLWASRLEMPDAELTDILNREATDVCVLRRGDAAVGMLEMTLADMPDAEICFFGIDAAEFGTGAGAWLMQAGLARAKAHGATRAWLHTCTLDHPRALPFYLRQGFRAFKRTVGVFVDPRVVGSLPADAGRHVPLIWPDGEDV